MFIAHQPPQKIPPQPQRGGMAIFEDSSWDVAPLGLGLGK
jgi:hypothetical protein